MKDGDELAELTLGLRAGRSDAWAQLYRLTHLPVLRFLASRLSPGKAGADPSHAEDLLQSVYVTAIESISKFSPQKGTVDMWLIGIAKNKLKESRRAQAHEFTPSAQGESSDVVDRLLDRSDSSAFGMAASSAGEHPDREAVIRALSLLEPRYAEVLRRKYVLNQSLAEIAQALGFNPSTVGIWLHRGRTKFRQVFTRLQRGDDAPGDQNADAVRPSDPVREAHSTDDGIGSGWPARSAAGG